MPSCSQFRALLPAANNAAPDTQATYARCANRYRVPEGSLSMAAEITRQDLQKRLNSRDDFVLVEALPAERYQQGHIPGALNLPPDKIRELAPRLLPDKNAEVILYCGSAT